MEFRQVGALSQLGNVGNVISARLRMCDQGFESRSERPWCLAGVCVVSAMLSPHICLVQVFRV